MNNVKKSELREISNIGLKGVIQDIDDVLGESVSRVRVVGVLISFCVECVCVWMTDVCYACVVAGEKVADMLIPRLVAGLKADSPPEGATYRVISVVLHMTNVLIVNVRVRICVFVCGVQWCKTRLTSWRICLCALDPLLSSRSNSCKRPFCRILRARAKASVVNVWCCYALYMPYCVVVLYDSCVCDCACDCARC